LKDLDSDNKKILFIFFEKLLFMRIDINKDGAADLGEIIGMFLMSGYVKSEKEANELAIGFFKSHFDLCKGKDLIFLNCS